MLQIKTLDEYSMRELIYTTVKGCLAEMQLDMYNKAPVIQPVVKKTENTIKRYKRSTYRELEDYFLYKHYENFPYGNHYDKPATLYICFNKVKKVFKINITVQPNKTFSRMVNDGNIIIFYIKCLPVHKYQKTGNTSIYFKGFNHFFSAKHKNIWYKGINLTRKDIYSMYAFIIKDSPYEKNDSLNIKSIKSILNSIEINNGATNEK